MHGSPLFDLLRVEVEMVVPGLVARLLLIAQGRRVIGVGEENACIERVDGTGLVRCAASLLKALQAGFDLMQSLLQLLLSRHLSKQGPQRFVETDLDPLFAPFHRFLADSGEPESALHQCVPHPIAFFGHSVLGVGALRNGRSPPVAKPGKRCLSAWPGAGGHGMAESLVSVQRSIGASAWVVSLNF